MKITVIVAQHRVNILDNQSTVGDLRCIKWVSSRTKRAIIFWEDNGPVGGLKIYYL